VGIVQSGDCLQLDDHKALYEQIDSVEADLILIIVNRV
jgi:hypothetical protein